MLDREAPMFADGKKVHPVNFEGKYFRCRGPLNAPRSPQGRVPICQAGGSGRGQEYAARWANTIITDAGSNVESMKAYREKVRRLAVAAGRDPNTIKVLFLVFPLIDVTMEAAQERRRLLRRTPTSIWTCNCPPCRASPTSISPSSIQMNRCRNYTPTGISRR